MEWDLASFLILLVFWSKKTRDAFLGGKGSSQVPHSKWRVQVSISSCLDTFSSSFTMLLLVAKIFQRDQRTRKCRVVSRYFVSVAYFATCNWRASWECNVRLLNFCFLPPENCLRLFVFPAHGLHTPPLHCHCWDSRFSLFSFSISEVQVPPGPRTSIDKTKSIYFLEQTTFSTAQVPGFSFIFSVVNWSGLCCLHLRHVLRFFDSIRFSWKIYWTFRSVVFSRGFLGLSLLPSVVASSPGRATSQLGNSFAGVGALRFFLSVCGSCCFLFVWKRTFPVRGIAKIFDQTVVLFWNVLWFVFVLTCEVWRVTERSGADRYVWAADTGGLDQTNKSTRIFNPIHHSVVSE